MSSPFLGWGSDILSEPRVPFPYLKYKDNNSCPPDLTGLSQESNEMMNVKVVGKLQIVIEMRGIVISHAAIYENEC